MKIPHTLLFLILIFYSQSVFSQNNITTREVDFLNDSVKLVTKICLPEGMKKPPVILIIAGSGPTDMDGNNFFMKNNHLKYLSEALARAGIASMRYNKRTILSSGNKIVEKELRFENFVEDAVFLLEKLKEDNQYGQLYVLGHSQGGLIATLASQEVKVKGLFLVAAAGKPIDQVIVTQIRASNEDLAKQAEIITDSLRSGYEVKKIHPHLNQLFRTNVQAFLASWMKYDPAEELQKVKAKKVIIQGERDIQVSREDAIRLEEMNPKADLYFIEEMNHVLKSSAPDREENIKTYSDPDLPVNEKLIDILKGYIK